MSTFLTNLFLGCFLFGFLMTMVSLLFGGDHFGGDGAHGHIGADGVSTGAHGVDTGCGGADAHDAASGGSKGAPFLGFTGLVMFLTFFGGVGYLLSRDKSAGVLIPLVGAIVAGFGGAIAVFLFMNKVLKQAETPMREVDYYLPGTLARVTSGIRSGGTGEVMYVQGGTRKTSAARSDEARAHPQGQEVVIVRCEKGIAYVRAVSPEALEGSA